VAAGSAAIDWQGGGAPCLSLLHAHDEVFDDRPRRVHAHRVGDVTRNSLAEIWSDPDYVAFRRRVQAFEFGPCFSCKRCALPLENEADCLEETFPVCGACLWSQGLVRCP
jgi:MoaA/NifB/PqqE/SkfB family radical SAM enzyme